MLNTIIIWIENATIQQIEDILKLLILWKHKTFQMPRHLNCSLTLSASNYVVGIFTHLELCLDLTRSITPSEWKLARLDKMMVNDFEILRIYDTFQL